MGGRNASRGHPRGPSHAATAGLPAPLSREEVAALPRAELEGLITELFERMRVEAKGLHFEAAARLRDEVADLRRELAAMTAAG